MVSTRQTVPIQAHLQSYHSSDTYTILLGIIYFADFYSTFTLFV